MSWQQLDAKLEGYLEDLEHVSLALLEASGEENKAKERLHYERILVLLHQVLSLYPQNQEQPAFEQALQLRERVVMSIEPSTPASMLRLYRTVVSFNPFLGEVEILDDA